MSGTITILVSPALIAEALRLPREVQIREINLKRQDRTALLVLESDAFTGDSREPIIPAVTDVPRQFEWDFGGVKLSRASHGWERTP